LARHSSFLLIALFLSLVTCHLSLLLAFLSFYYQTRAPLIKLRQRYRQFTLDIALSNQSSCNSALADRERIIGQQIGRRFGHGCEHVRVAKRDDDERRLTADQSFCDMLSCFRQRHASFTTARSHCH